MLVLGRKVGEKLTINGNIVVQIVKIQGNRITIGIEAPADVKVLRSELNETKPRAQVVELVTTDSHFFADFQAV